MSQSPTAAGVREDRPAGLGQAFLWITGSVRQLALRFPRTAHFQYVNVLKGATQLPLPDVCGRTESSDAPLRSREVFYCQQKQSVGLLERRNEQSDDTSGGDEATPRILAGCYTTGTVCPRR